MVGRGRFAPLCPFAQSDAAQKEARLHGCNSERRSEMKRRFSLLALALAVGSMLPPVQGQKRTPTDWPTFGNDPGGQRYSGLTQINPANVTKLARAWTYHMKPANDAA